jgi:hypothetical protein
LEKNYASAGQLRPREGERLSYLIKYLWVIPVGTVEVEVGKSDAYRNKQVYPLVAKGSVSPFIARFVKAEGVIKSWVDTRRFYPWRYEEKAHAEGHRPSRKVIEYDQAAHIMEFEKVRRKIPNNTQDPLSALFYLRWQEYGKDEEISLNVNSNQENYTLLTRLRKRNTITHGAETMAVFITDSVIKSPKRHARSEAKITTYMLGETRRIPFLLKIRTKFGPLVVRLTGVAYK